MRDEDLFSNELQTVETAGIRKEKYLLNDKDQDVVLAKATQIAKKLAKSKKIDKVAIIGSAVTKQLGKYETNHAMRNDYSDIDLFVLLNCSMREVSLAELSLVKKKYRAKLGGKMKTYYRVSVSDGKGNPLKIFDRFSVDLWLITPGTYPKTMKYAPNLLEGCIQIK